MSIHHAALNSARWAHVRGAVLQRAGRRCEQCGRAGRLEAHHVEQLQHGGAPYELKNLRVLCRLCHIAEHRTRRHFTPSALAWQALVKELQPCAN